jgi:DNA-binding protein HU-beta
MNKTDLIKAIAIEGEVTRTSAAIMLDRFIDIVFREDKVTVPGFGTFKHVVRPAHEARNPSTGETIRVPEKTVLKFKASK